MQGKSLRGRKSEGQRVDQKFEDNAQTFGREAVYRSPRVREPVHLMRVERPNGFETVKIIGDISLSNLFQNGR